MVALTQPCLDTLCMECMATCRNLSNPVALHKVSKANSALCGDESSTSINMIRSLWEFRQRTKLSVGVGFVGMLIMLCGVELLPAEVDDANEENNHNNSTLSLNEISVPRWPKGASCHGYERERERYLRVWKNEKEMREGWEEEIEFELMLSSKFAFEEKAVFDWMISPETYCYLYMVAFWVNNFIDLSQQNFLLQ